MKGLAEVMNRLPGIHTYTSCGGHRKITDPSQCGEGEFTVGFAVDPTDEGLLSVGIITLAAERVDSENIMVRTYVCDDSPYELAFHVNGKNKASPDDLAVRILSIYRKGLTSD